jgi:hypothetical protein
MRLSFGRALSHERGKRRKRRDGRTSLTRDHAPSALLHLGSPFVVMATPGFAKNAASRASSGSLPFGSWQETRPGLGGDGGWLERACEPLD